MEDPRLLLTLLLASVFVISLIRRYLADSGSTRGDHHRHDTGGIFPMDSGASSGHGHHGSSHGHHGSCHHDGGSSGGHGHGH